MGLQHQLEAKRSKSRFANLGIRKFFHDNRDILRAYVIFLMVTIVGFGAVLADWSSGHVLDPMNNWTASASGTLIGAFGGVAHVSANRITSNASTVTIAEGCNAVYVNIIFLAAVFAYPTSLEKRLLGAFLGTFALFAINLLRVISLLYLRSYDARLFEEAHLHIWQFLIIILGGLLWLLWYDKIVKRHPHASNLQIPD